MLKRHTSNIVVVQDKNCLKELKLAKPLSVVQKQIKHKKLLSLTLSVCFQIQGFCFNSLRSYSVGDIDAASAFAVCNLKDIDSGCFPERKQVMTLISNFFDLTNPIITSENVYSEIKLAQSFTSKPDRLE